MLTDNDIRNLQNYVGVQTSPATVHELCTRLLAAEAEAETLRRNNDVLRADLLDVMRDRDEALAKVKVLEEALRRVAYGPENVNQSYAEIWAEHSLLARAALQEQESK